MSDFKYPPEVLRRRNDSEEARLRYIVEYQKDPNSESTEAAWNTFQELDRLYTGAFVNFINSLLSEKES